ncbi:putative DMBT1-like protein [Fukomys damarensis]|uniref:putative DMBT1-like protein n=1 Tax=Fukomys damarensis TaxID=885580 RepID=UPI001454FDD7|nr:putative DMBT1-like protein [Fukomys damarensis]
MFLKDLAEATVVCCQLQCGQAVAASSGAHSGTGSRKILLDGVQCVGSESHLGQCMHGSQAGHKCRHLEDAGVICAGDGLAAAPHTPQSPRLPFTSTAAGHVSSTTFPFSETAALKLMLRPEGRGRGCLAVTKKVVLFFVLTLFPADGGNLFTSSVWPAAPQTILTPTDAESSTSQPEGGWVPVWLVGTDERCAGRVELFCQEVWGTVCDDLWDFPQANVICRQLGCGWAISAPVEAHFGEGSGKILLDNVHCRGTEQRLEESTHVGWFSHNCGHGEDASVICSDAEYSVVTSPGRPVAVLAATMATETYRCGGTITNSSGAIRNPPKNEMHDNITCMWEIKANASDHILLAFPYLKQVLNSLSTLGSLNSTHLFSCGFT